MHKRGKEAWKRESKSLPVLDKSSSTVEREREREPPEKGDRNQSIP